MRFLCSLILSEIFFLDVIGNETLRTTMNDNFESVAPIAFCYERHTEFSKNVSRELKKFYLNNQDVDKTQLNGLSEVWVEGI